MSFGVTASSYYEAASSGSAYADLVLASSPLVYWRLGEPNSSSPAADASGNGRDGTYVNNPAGGGSNPLVIQDLNTSFWLDKSDETNVTLTDAAWMDVSAMTVTLVYMADTGSPVGFQVLASRYDYTTGSAWYLVNEDSVFKFYYRTSGGVDVNIDSGFTLRSGGTYYLAAYAGPGGSGIRVYEYGSLVGSATGAGGTVNPSSVDLIVGSPDNPTTGYASGLFQEFAFFGTALATSTIDALAALATTPQPKWINRAAGVAPRNGTTDHTINFTAASAGSLLTVIASASATTTAVTAGWTKEQSAILGAEVALFSRIATGGENSLQVTHNSSNYTMHYIVYEFAAGSTLYASDKNDNGDAPALTGLPGTPVDVFVAIGEGSANPSDPPGANAKWGYQWIEDFDTMTIDDGVTEGIFTTVGYKGNITATTTDPANEGFFDAVYETDFINNRQTVIFAITRP